VELIRAVRRAVSPDFPVVFRFSQWKQGDYRHKLAKDPRELEAFLTPLSEAGVDYFHASTRRFNDPEFEGSELNLAGWTKKDHGQAVDHRRQRRAGFGFSAELRGQGGATRGDRRAHRAARAGRVRPGRGRPGAAGRCAWANKVREGREDEIRVFTPELMKTLD
jgi:2,4-dienoyl-CoA reductase-like NADH-dependent reductase (Old Yellow Enzyme family)